METLTASEPETVRRARAESTPPGPTSTKAVTPLSDSPLRVWCQRTGLHSWADRRPGHSSAVAWGRASTFAVTGISGSANEAVARAFRNRWRAAAMSGV